MTAFLTGPKLYTPTNYVYDSATVFDNTVLTWGTDYLLALTHGSLCVRILLHPSQSALKVASAALVGSFALSTLSGAICHQFLWTALNTWYFRLMWRICVGAVAAAGGILGICATELATIPIPPNETLRFPVILVPRYFWVVWSIFFFGVVWSGLYSMKNPACDIFLTGVTQSPPTFYMAYVLLARRSWENVVKTDQILLLLVGLLSNAALLPGYDLLNYLQLRDGICNVFLHTVLFCAWSSQAISLNSFVTGMESRVKNE